MKKSIIKNLFFHFMNIGFCLLFIHIFYMGERFIHTINHRLYLITEPSSQKLLYILFLILFVISILGVMNWLFYSKKLSFIHILGMESQLIVFETIFFIIIVANKLSFFWCL